MVQAQLNHRLCPVPALACDLFSRWSEPGPVKLHLGGGRLGSPPGTVWHTCCPFSLLEGVLRDNCCFAPAPSPHWQRHPHVHKPRWKLLWWKAGSCRDLYAEGLHVHLSGCFFLPHILALKPWPCLLLTSDELLSNSVCNDCRSCFHLGVFPSLLSLSPFPLHISPFSIYGDREAQNLWKAGLQSSLLRGNRRSVPFAAQISAFPQKVPFPQLLLGGGCGTACGAMQAACPAGTRSSVSKCS